MAYTIDDVKGGVTVIKSVNWKVWAIFAGIIIALSFTGAWYLWKPKLKVPDNKPAPAIIQTDGSVVVEKVPDTNHKPVHKIPKGTKVERDFSVTVQPDKPADPVTGKCPPVKIDLSLVRDEKTLTKRVVASSPDGKVIDGIDIPVDDAVVPPNPKLWAIGAAYSSRGGIGGFVDRDLAWVRLGAQVNTIKESGGGVEGWVKAGIRF